MEILQSNIAGVVPTVSQLMTTDLGMGWNRVDAKLYGLQIVGSVKTVVLLAQGVTSGSDHSQLHAMNSPTDHAAADITDRDKLVATNPLTGAIEFIPKSGFGDQFWQRPVPGEVIPVNVDDLVSFFGSGGNDYTTLGAALVGIWSFSPAVFMSELFGGANAYDLLKSDEVYANYAGSGVGRLGYAMEVKVGGTAWSSSNWGTSWEIKTCKDGTILLLPRIKILGNGDVLLGDIANSKYVKIAEDYLKAKNIDVDVQLQVGSNYERFVAKDGYSTINGRADKARLHLARSLSGTSYVTANTILSEILMGGTYGASLHYGVILRAKVGSSDYSAGNAGTIFDLQTIPTGSITPSSRIQVDESGNVNVNEDGLATDLRVEGDTDQNLLKVQGSTDRIGIGAGGSIDSKLHIKTKSTEATPALKIEQSDEDQAFVNYAGTTSSGTDKNISTNAGSGSVIGPKGYVPGVSSGWKFEGMRKIQVNGSDYWEPYYSWMEIG